MDMLYEYDEEKRRVLQLTKPEQTGLIECNCCHIAPTMPVYRTFHLPHCPFWAIDEIAALKDAVVALQAEIADLKKTARDGAA